MGNIKAKKKKRKYRRDKIDFQTIEISMHSGQKVEYFRSNNQPDNLQRQVKT